MKYPAVILVVGSLLVAIAWIAACLKWIPFDMEQMSTLFTGLGFVGVIAAFLHERQQAAEADREHLQLLAAMRSQSKNICHGARVNAMAATLNWSREELAHINLVNVDMTTGSGATQARRLDSLRSNIRQLEEQLEKASTITELF
jgi:hypothetical protein